MVSVSIYHLEDGEDAIAGTITWDGQSLVAEPADDPLLRGILAEPADVPLPGGREFAVLADDPEAWLKNLYRGYTSAYLRAGRPVSDEDEPVPPELVAAILELRAEGKDDEAAELERLAADPEAVAKIMSGEGRDAGDAGTFR